MPELPEVETTRRGIAPYLQGIPIRGLVIRTTGLRWPIPSRQLQRNLPGQTIIAVERRAKYLLLRCTGGTIIIHLGMSGSLRLLTQEQPPGKHDHFDLLLENDTCLRLTDPRRFGAILWTRDDPQRHPLLAALGPEPLSEACSGQYLYTRSRGKRVAIKSFLMNSRIICGVGNIYANEALFMAGIHPARAAGRISLGRYERLAQCVRQVLQESIAQGGTTLRDFVNGEGKPGYFRLYLRVYGKGGSPCPQCASPLREIRQGQRSTVYCSQCQH